MLSFGATHKSTLLHTVVLQIVEMDFALFPLIFCHPFPVMLAFDSGGKELEFLSVPLGRWCPEIEWADQHAG